MAEVCREAVQRGWEVISLSRRGENPLPGTPLDKVYPEAKNIVILAECVVELVRRAPFAWQAGVDGKGLPAQHAPLGGRQLLGASARARCTC